MSKKRHGKDKLYLTYNEHKSDWGGKKDDRNAPISRLPYFSCSLSLLPFENPVCSPEGDVFDIMNIVPFIRKYRKNPVSGKELKMTQLIKLNFHKNDKGEYHDPVSFKCFSDFTKIVAIKTSGNVFASDTIEELNRKPKFWRDLLTDEAFTLKDLIVLQDPTNLKFRTVTDFDYVKNDIVFSLVKSDGKKEQYINQDGTSKKIFEEIQQQREKEQNEEPKLKKKIHQDEEKEDKESTNYYVRTLIESKTQFHQTFTEGKVATSVTSTNWDPETSGKNQLRALTEEEIRKKYYDIVVQQKKKTFVSLVTNFGSINIQLHSDLVPRTCENFVELCERKYFDNIKFHRLVNNFMVQGGDPTGKGKGGESIFGKKFQDEFHPKLSHNQFGTLSMANSGTNTNGSQFFFTLSKDCTQLDKKHTVFGEVVGGKVILDKINSIDADNKERPIVDVLIYHTNVYQNPFREAIKSIKMQAEHQEQEGNLADNKKSHGNLQDQFKFKEKEKSSNSLLNTLLYQ